MPSCNKYFFCSVILGGIFLFSNCDDIIEPDITKEVVVLLAPTDSAVSTSIVQTLQWEPVNGARQYHVQLARPSFENPSIYFLDTTTAKNNFAIPLSPGMYHWRIQATNNSYKTSYSERFIHIDSTGSLTGQNILLLQPNNGAVTSNPIVIFAWAALPMAQRYLLNLQPNPRGVGTSFDTLLTSNPSVTIRLPRQSIIYRWKITALNGLSSQQSATQNFEIDLTAPVVSAFSAPADNAFFSNLPILLTWNRSGTDVNRDSVYLYKSDKQTLANTFPRLSTSTSIVLSAGANQLQPGTYYWALRSFDRAGNRSNLSKLRSFILQ